MRTFAEQDTARCHSFTDPGPFDSPPQRQRPVAEAPGVRSGQAGRDCFAALLNRHSFTVSQPEARFFAGWRREFASGEAALRAEIVSISIIRF
jgi:hypothetical protein